jgi:hypothetical protein
VRLFERTSNRVRLERFERSNIGPVLISDMNTMQSPGLDVGRRLTNWSSPSAAVQMHNGGVTHLLKEASKLLRFADPLKSGKFPVKAFEPISTRPKPVVPTVF